MLPQGHLARPYSSPPGLVLFTISLASTDIHPYDLCDGPSPLPSPIIIKTPIIIYKKLGKH